VIYRFYELVLVNGPALEAPIEEEFGDGIMSAIDFDITAAMCAIGPKLTFCLHGRMSAFGGKADMTIAT
jgi:cyanate lyase